RHSFQLDPDSTEYLSNAALPLFSLDFWAGPRPFTVPLFYKMFGVTSATLLNALILQGFLSTTCWLFLAWQTARSLETDWLRPIAFVVILILGLTNAVLVWDSVILSESLSVSFLALMVGGWLWLLRK